jgi:hypothetical protein
VAVGDMLVLLFLLREARLECEIVVVVFDDKMGI